MQFIAHLIIEILRFLQKCVVILQMTSAFCAMTSECLPQNRSKLSTLSFLYFETNKNHERIKNGQQLPEWLTEYVCSLKKDPEMYDHPIQTSSSTILSMQILMVTVHLQFSDVISAVKVHQDFLISLLQPKMIYAFLTYQSLN